MVSNSKCSTSFRKSLEARALAAVESKYQAPLRQLLELLAYQPQTVPVTELQQDHESKPLHNPYSSGLNSEPRDGSLWLKRQVFAGILCDVGHRDFGIMSVERPPFLADGRLIHLRFFFDE
jgi:hypothetical protein